MADYQELLRRAISALPENNGAARRAVYEKARSALVGQLRAITPPLPAREITQHRLQLEDCIRQVELAASEAIISLGRDDILAVRTPIKPTVSPVDEAVPVESKPVPEASLSVSQPVPKPAESAPPIIQSASSIESIIAETADLAQTGDDSTLGSLTADAEPASGQFPAIGRRAETGKLLPAAMVSSSPAALARSFEPQAPSARPEDDGVHLKMPQAERVEAPQVSPYQPDQEVKTELVEPALFTVREVEIETDASAAQDVIERAIETLDREARGELTPVLSSPDPVGSGVPVAANMAEDDYTTAPVQRRSGSGFTIFLVVCVILLAGVGGTGFWAWREGYVDLDQLFGQAQNLVSQAAEVPNDTPTFEPIRPGDDDMAAGPGNTASTTISPPSGEISDLEGDDMRLQPTPEPVEPTGMEAVLPSIEVPVPEAEERLPNGNMTTINDPAATVDPAILAGSQSLLLEASTDGQSGAVPFSGTVEWREGVDDLGLSTLIGSASIPARNMGIEVTISRNRDPILPANYLMEVDFRVTDTFIGGTIANLVGVLLKNEELVPGTALIGASARLRENSFLFAIGADASTNRDLLENRRWMDLAVVYGTGRNAIITLEKDDEAQALFDKVFAAWESD